MLAFHPSPPIRSARIAFIITIAVLTGTTVACSKTPPPPPAASTAAPPPQPAPSIAADDPPSALVQVGEMAENLFDSARAGNWSRAAERLQALRRAGEDLPTSVQNNDLRAQLRVRLHALERHAAARQKVQTMGDANAITRLAAELSEQYRTPIPYAVTMLDYFGRQLEIGIAARNRATLKRTTADLRQTWDHLEPTILRRGHADDARRFTDIVVKLEGCRRPSDFVAPTRAELDAVDRLEAIFPPSK
jgi:signal transduction histidine kinase